MWRYVPYGLLPREVCEVIRKIPFKKGTGICCAGVRFADDGRSCVLVHGDYVHDAFDPQVKNLRPFEISPEFQELILNAQQEAVAGISVAA